MLANGDAADATGWEELSVASVTRNVTDDVKQSSQAPILSVAAEAAIHQDVLGLEPPKWLPDSYAGSCGSCHLPVGWPPCLRAALSSPCNRPLPQFLPLRRLKHHCRQEYVTLRQSDAMPRAAPLATTTKCVPNDDRRMCGKIFCHSCCFKRMLLPPKYTLRQAGGLCSRWLDDVRLVAPAHRLSPRPPSLIRDPQRVCELCSCVLKPLQAFLAGTQARP